MAEKRRRSRQQVTEDLLVKRLNGGQLLSLVDLKNFEPFQVRIRQELASTNGFDVEDFEKVHGSGDCDVQVVDTGEKVIARSTGYDFGEFDTTLEVKRLECGGHGSASADFIYADMGQRQRREVRKLSL